MITMQINNTKKMKTNMMTRLKGSLFNRVNQRKDTKALCSMKTAPFMVVSSN